MDNNPVGTSSSRSSFARNPMDSTIPPPGASSSRNQLTCRDFGSVSEQVRNPIHPTISPPLQIPSVFCAVKKLENLMFPPLYPISEQKITNLLTF
jgi:hypothetical protein